MEWLGDGVVTDRGYRLTCTFSGQAAFPSVVYQCNQSNIKTTNEHAKTQQTIIEAYGHCSHPFIFKLEPFSRFDFDLSGCQMLAAGVEDLESHFFSQFPACLTWDQSVHYRHLYIDHVAENSPLLGIYSSREESTTSVEHQAHNLMVSSPAFVWLKIPVKIPLAIAQNRYGNCESHITGGDTCSFLLPSCGSYWPSNFYLWRKTNLQH